MSLNPVATASLSGDAALLALRQDPGATPKEAVREAARQFETMLVQELLKNMRAGNLGADWLGNDASNLGTELLDAQLAHGVSGRPGGLGELIARQLERQLKVSGGADGKESARVALERSRLGLPADNASPLAATSAEREKASTFVQEHLRAARLASRETGIPAAYILGQAAHESGWGRHVIRNADGSTSHNLFGIKAGASWEGKVARITTTEYVDGKPLKTVANFRAYDSYEQAFLDWAALIKNSPRYAPVVENGKTARGFAQELQNAGYATDPAYAQKLGGVIQTAIRLQGKLS